MALQELAHLRELREHQRAVAAGQHLFQHLGQPSQLARPTGDGGVVAEELRRVVADLLQLHQRGEDEALALDAVAPRRVLRRLP